MPTDTLPTIAAGTLRNVGVGIRLWATGKDAMEIRRMYNECIAPVRSRHGFANRPAPLLTPPDANAKLDHTDAPTYALTLAMASTSGIANLCPWSTAECRAVCVLRNGNGAYPVVQRAREWKTDLLVNDPIVFGVALAHELSKLPAGTRVRLNAASDIRWETVEELFATFPELKFYDYSKSIVRANASLGVRWPENYRLVYSVSDRSDIVGILSHLAEGGFVAIVTNRRKGNAIMNSWHGFPVVDGDTSDDLWRLAPGTVTDLSAKGRAKSLSVGGFVKDLAAF